MSAPSPIASICDQRRQIALFNKPPTRLELAFPPRGFTTAQFDMRRKAEILKYNSTQSSTKTNNLTKAQKYALVSNNNSSGGLSQYYIANADLTAPICPNDISLATPSYACDVPGPLVYLHYDPTVPLYNYVTNNDAYGIINSEPTGPFKVYTTNDIYFADGSQNTLLFLEFTTLAAPGYATFSMNIPISIHIDTLRIIYPYILNTYIRNIDFSVYYNEQRVTLIQNPIINYIPNHLDLSFSRVSINDPFYANQYIGYLNITGIKLNIAPTFVYDLRLTLTFATYIPQISVFVTYVNAGAYANIIGANDKYYSDSSYCNIISPIYSPFVPFSFTQTG
jgi:hypothetical protein